MLNRARILAVADVIERHPDWYDQNTWEGRPCCIAGHALRLARADRYGVFTERAAAVLGLTTDQARVLFCASWQPPEGMTVPNALRLLAFGATINQVTAERSRWHVPLTRQILLPAPDLEPWLEPAPAAEPAAEPAPAAEPERQELQPA